MTLQGAKFVLLTEVLVRCDIENNHCWFPRQHRCCPDEQFNRFRGGVAWFTRLDFQALHSAGTSKQSNGQQNQGYEGPMSTRQVGDCSARLQVLRECSTSLLIRSINRKDVSRAFFHVGFEHLLLLCHQSDPSPPSGRTRNLKIMVDLLPRAQLTFLIGRTGSALQHVDARQITSCCFSCYHMYNYGNRMMCLEKTHFSRFVFPISRDLTMATETDIIYPPSQRSQLYKFHH